MYKNFFKNFFIKIFRKILKLFGSDPFKIKLTIGTAIFIKDEIIDNLVF